MQRISIATLSLALALACDHDHDHDHDADLEAPRAGASAVQHVQPAAPQHLGDVQTMPAAEAAFAEILALVDAKYVDPEVGRDALYTGAAEGLLARLYQVGDHPVNALLSPRELEELTRGSEGAIVGVGVQIELVAGVVVVRDVIAGGPAAAAGLQAGDRILGIDDARVHALTIAQVVDKIRGPAGSEVDLFLQRDTEEWHATMKRATVAIQNVQASLDGDIGVVALRGFAERTPAELDAAVAGLRAQGAKALILDLRDCPGGVFDAAVAVAGRFLARGQAIAGIAGRDGAVQKFAAEADGELRDLPLAVLVGPNTSSGAEVLADALRTHGRATLVGQATLGKDSVEHVHALANGWGLKLSTGRLLGADGEPRRGRGIHPQLVVPGGEAGDEAEGDAAISVARAWLRERPR